MNNRADRRASAKLAKLALKRAKSPLETAILKAASAFADEASVHEIGPHLSDPAFDAALERLDEALADILDQHYSAFMVELYLEAGTLRARADGEGRVWTARLFLCPISGEAGRVRAFASDADACAELASSLLRSGVVEEGGRCRVLPRLLDPSLFSPRATSPGSVRTLHDALVASVLSEGADDAPAGLLDRPVDEVAQGLGGSVVGALLGIELVAAVRQAGRSAAATEDAEAMARDAAIASWYDSYADELDGIALGAPLDWPACAAALAFEMVRVPLDEARRAQGMIEAGEPVIHCGPTRDGSAFCVAAVSGSLALGPFYAPGDLAWFDVDTFFDCAAAHAGEVIEHEDERPVLALFSS